MCSYGVGNVGTYNSSFASMDISEQMFNNPAGQYNHTQLIDQAVNQTYIITDLFNSSNMLESFFSTFLPNDTMPTTAFLSDPAPTKPTIDTSATTIDTSTTTIDTNPSTESTSPSITDTILPDDSGATSQEEGIISIISSCAMMAMLVSNIIMQL